MLVSRSTEESHLYMYLHPCVCGEADFDWRDHEIVPGGRGLLSVYTGECGGCGRSRGFEFALAPEPSPPAPALGGLTASRIIDPGEFLDTARRLADTVPSDPETVDDDEFHGARDAIAYAIACLDEVLKFIPDGAREVPATAFRSAVGARLHREEPHRFTLSSLARTRDSYRRLLVAYDAAIPAAVPAR